MKRFSLKYELNVKCHTVGKNPVFQFCGRSCEEMPAQERAFLLWIVLLDLN